MPGRTDTTTRLEAPTLDAYRNDDTLWAWCDHEQAWHRHSGRCACPDFITEPDGDGLCRCPVGVSDGHRGAHCRCPSSPYRESGYHLREVGDLTEEQRARPVAGYFTGCREDSCRLRRATRRHQLQSPHQLPDPKDPLAVAHLLTKGYADPDFVPDDPAYDGFYLTYDVSFAWRTIVEALPELGPDEQPSEPVDTDHDLEPEHVPVLHYTPDRDGPLVLRRWRGVWMRWHRTHWSELEDVVLGAELYDRLGAAVYHRRTKEGIRVETWKPNRSSVGEVLKAMEGLTVLPSDTEAPLWLDGRPGADRLVSCRNGLLDITTRQVHEHEPDLFNLVTVPITYDPDAAAPTRWLRFLHQLWPDDPDSIATLQEWFGYVISGRTDLQKMLLIVGPPRAGKGTIVRALQQLIGRANYAGPTLASLSTNFGLQALIGKPLAVIADARLGGRDTHVVVERLLSITGEDSLTVDRKYRDPWTGQLPTRLMLLSNELPHFGDASGAIATRFVALTLQHSWLGREDTGLDRALTEELPGILGWALDGLERLTERGRLTEPESARDSILAMTDSASPTGAFVRDWCEVGAGLEVPVNALFAAWQRWCQVNGREHPGSVQTFGRTLTSVVPTVRLVRPRDPITGQQVRTYAGIGLRRAETRPPSMFAQEEGQTSWQM